MAPPAMSELLILLTGILVGLLRGARARRAAGGGLAGPLFASLGGAVLGAGCARLLGLAVVGSAGEFFAALFGALLGQMGHFMLTRRGCD